MPDIENQLAPVSVHLHEMELLKHFTIDGRFSDVKMITATFAREIQLLSK